MSRTGVRRYLKYKLQEFLWPHSCEDKLSLTEKQERWKFRHTEL